MRWVCSLLIACFLVLVVQWIVPTTAHARAIAHVALIDLPQEGQDEPSTPASESPADDRDDDSDDDSDDDDDDDDRDDVHIAPDAFVLCVACRELTHTLHAQRLHPTPETEIPTPPPRS